MGNIFVRQYAGAIALITLLLLAIALPGAHLSYAQTNHQVQSARSSPSATYFDFSKAYRRVSEEIEKRLIREDINPSPAEPEETSADDGGGGSGGQSGSQKGREGDEGNEGAEQPSGQYGGSNESYGYDTPASVPSKKDEPPAPRPADVDSGHDDDIVAKQIREAAEAETNPEIREKLWEEYRQYKANQ